MGNIVARNICNEAEYFDPEPRKGLTYPHQSLAGSFSIHPLQSFGTSALERDERAPVTTGTRQ